MSTDVKPVAQFANPISGEVLTLDSPDEDLSRYLNDLREYKSVISEHKRMVDRELIRRMDKRAKYTFHFPGGLKISAPSPKPEESWDGAELRAALMEFVDRDVLSIETVTDAVEQSIEYTVKKRGVNSLRALGGEIGELIEALCTKSDRDRYVSVGRSS